MSEKYFDLAILWAILVIYVIFERLENFKLWEIEQMVHHFKVGNLKIPNM